jgi:phospholipid transport system transporter-binding protein
VSSPAASAAGGAPNAASFEVVTSGPGRFAVRGVLTFANARRARNEGLNALQASSESDLEMDCSGITLSDSAGLAVMLDWMAIMKREGRPLCFSHVPCLLLAVARISGVEDMLRRCG